MKPAWLNANLFGAVILFGSFIISIWIVMVQTGTLDRFTGREERVVRFLHWQLEPGFREALDKVIAEYNALPHVREAGYRVQQVAISEKFYSQFLNTHLISGTAPDLSTMGKASLASQVDQFYEPLAAIVDEPNHYNTEETVPDHLLAEIRRALIEGPWRDTFADGLQSGYNDQLKNYYAIPVSNWGSIRLYYNRGYMKQAKAIVLEALESEVRPAWLEARLIPPGGTTDDGWLPDTPELREWLRSDRSVDTLGRLLLVSDAVWELARRQNLPFLVPISGSSYTRDLFADRYAPTFHHGLVSEFDLDHDSNISALETFGAWSADKWRFEDEEVRAYFKTLREIATHFPRGFLGLDREQANRRFIMQNAAMLLTGGWDASGIFKLAREQADPFEVGVALLPVPGPGERFHGFANQPPSEAGQTLGVPMALYKLSSMKDEAIDFLRYLTSYKGNQMFVDHSGWLPATIGVEPTREMRPFMPETAGIIGSLHLRFLGGNVATVYRGQLYLYIGGDITYEEFVANVEAAMGDRRMGVNRLWAEQFQRDRQVDRNTQMTLSTQAIRYLSGIDPDAEERYFQILQRSLTLSNGLNNRMMWHRFFPGEPEPEF